MVTYGFYNSINHDRVYDATQMSEIFDGIIRDGVYQYVGNKFLVDINGLEGFQVRVGTGRAWFNHTWTKNDAPLILTLPAPPTLDNYYRADAIVIDINANVNVRENKITYVTGTEVADNPSPPYPELLDGEHKQVALAYIVRKGSETEINAANINYVVGSNPCPYVTAPVQAVDLSAHVAQWETAWNQWFNTKTTGWDEALAAAEADIASATSGVNTHANNAKTTINEYVAEFQVWIASQKSQFTGWMSSSKEDFDTWFANLHYILDGDVAGHLQNEIDDINTAIIPTERGGTGNSEGYIRSGFRNTTSYVLGSFSTSEGMNTIASGESSHAEGGGSYTISEPVETTGMYGPSTNMFNITKAYSNNWTNWYDTLYDNSLTLETGWNIGNDGILNIDYGDAFSRRALPNISWIPETPEQEEYGVRHCYFGVIVRNTDTDDILYHRIFCCGPDDTEDPDFTDCEYRVSSRDITYNDQVYTCKTETVQRGGYLSSILPYEEFTDNCESYVLFKNSDIALTAGRENVYGNIASSKFTLQTAYGGPDGNTKFNNYGTYFIPNLYLFNIRLHEGNPINDISKYQVEVYFTGDGKIEYLEAGKTKIIINGEGSKAEGKFSHAEGEKTNAIGVGSHTEGYQTIARGQYSHAEGYTNSTLVDHSNWPAANGYASHTEGESTTAIGDYSHAEGYKTIAEGDGSHASGYTTKAIGESSMSMGSFTEAIGNNAFSGGYGAKAIADAQFVYGYDAGEWSGSYDIVKKLHTSLFGLPGEPIIKASSYDETSNVSDIVTLNEIADKNKSGISIFLQCPTTKNGKYYKTILPNNAFGTYLEFIDLAINSPSDQVTAYSGRVLKLNPSGLIEVAKLFETNSLTNVMVVGQTKSFTIDGVTYLYPVINLINSIDDAVSTGSVTKYLKYVLIRLF